MGRRIVMWTAIAVWVAAPGCGGGEDSGSGEAGGATSGSLRPTTTLEPKAAELLLAGDGIGDLYFGTPAAMVTSLVDVAFGPPKIDSYTGEPIGDSLYRSLLGGPTDLGNAWIHAQPALQIRCHPNGLCLVLGGPSLSELAFTGWTYSVRVAENGQPVVAESKPVRTVDGVTLGTSTADLPGIVNRTAPGCYSSVGFANAERSIKATFDDFWEELGRAPEPPPGTVFVVASMSAGTVMAFADGCA